MSPACGVPEPVVLEPPHATWGMDGWDRRPGGPLDRPEAGPTFFLTRQSKIDGPLAPREPQAEDPPAPAARAGRDALYWVLLLALLPLVSAVFDEKEESPAQRLQRTL